MKLDYQFFYLSQDYTKRTLKKKLFAEITPEKKVSKLIKFLELCFVFLGHSTIIASLQNMVFTIL